MTLPRYAQAAPIVRSRINVGHAETGRTWQARQFRHNCGKALNAHGSLLTLHDAYRAVTTADPAPDIRQPADRTTAVIIPSSVSLDDQDPIVLELLQLAAEAIIAHPEAVPPDLLHMLDDYAAHLHHTLHTAHPGQLPVGT